MEGGFGGEMEGLKERDQCTSVFNFRKRKNEVGNEWVTCNSR